MDSSVRACVCDGAQARIHTDQHGRENEHVHERLKTYEKVPLRCLKENVLCIKGNLTGFKCSPLSSCDLLVFLHIPCCIYLKKYCYRGCCCLQIWHRLNSLSPCTIVDFWCDV